MKKVDNTVIDVRSHFLLKPSLCEIFFEDVGDTLRKVTGKYMQGKDLTLYNNKVLKDSNISDEKGFIPSPDFALEMTDKLVKMV
jgi:hypothetical protein